jgi:hypothetical protein
MGVQIAINCDKIGHLPSILYTCHRTTNLDNQQLEQGLSRYVKLDIGNKTGST